MSDSEKVRLGVAATQFIEHEIYQKAKAAMKEGIFDNWERCPVTDKETQHELKLMLKLFNDLDGNIVQIIDTGKLALDNMKYKEGKLKQTLKLWRS